MLGSLIFLQPICVQRFVNEAGLPAKLNAGRLFGATGYSVNGEADTRDHIAIREDLEGVAVVFRAALLNVCSTVWVGGLNYGYKMCRVRQ